MRAAEPSDSPLLSSESTSPMSTFLSHHAVDDEHMAKWPWGLSFQTQRCPSPAVVWSNRRLPYVGGEAALLKDFAWQVPLAPGTAPANTPTKTFYAECYGGDGVQNNGGGVRAAWSGDWLIKGTGINLLSGYSDEEAAQYRLNGRASLTDMLFEATWGEVLHYALPFGAVRMTAVLKTGETINSTWQPTGGLGIRQFTWRPAHVMRAPAFKVRAEHRGSIPHDTSRVKDAISLLPGILPMPAGLTAADLAKLTPQKRLLIGLEEMVMRFSEQMAAARAKRISHGTLNTSNIALDGRWNDLNTVSSLPGFGARPSLTPFWHEHCSLFSTIDLISFYISKYFPTEGSERLQAQPLKEWLTSTYNKYFADALTRRFVSLCGYPQCVAENVWARPDGKVAMRTLAKTLTLLARSGHSHRRPYSDALDESEVAGDYDLFKILRDLANRRPASNEPVICEESIQDKDLRSSFSQQYRAVEKMMYKEARKQGVVSSNFARLVAVNCAKAGRDMSSLYRNILYLQCQHLAENHADPDVLPTTCQAELDSVIDHARMIYQESRHFKTLLWCSGHSTIEYDARSNVLVVTTPEKKFELSCHPSTWVAKHHLEVDQLLNAMQSYWGEHYKEFIQ